MKNRVPVPASERPPIPAFTPVPRKYRHDGWTPERQRAFIAALADCGSVRRACAMVNMANENAYVLRRAPGAEGFRAAWDAALDFGVKRLKDIAFERAVEGELVPVFVAGKLMGFRRKHNDALLMFCLRHYGEDAQGKRVTVNYFSTKAVAGASAGVVQAGVAQDESAPPPPPAAAVPLPIAARQGGSGVAQDESAPPPPSVVPLPQQSQLSLGGGGSVAEASTTTVRTVINGSGAGVDLEGAAGVLEGFAGVVLDAQAQAAIAAALEACAARARAVDEEPALAAAEADPEIPFARVNNGDIAYAGQLVPGLEWQAPEPFLPDEMPWRHAGEEVPAYWAETAEKLGMLVPVAPAPEPKPARRRAGRKR